MEKINFSEMLATILEEMDLLEDKSRSSVKIFQTYDILLAVSFECHFSFILITMSTLSNGLKVRSNICMLLGLNVCLRFSSDSLLFCKQNFCNGWNVYKIRLKNLGNVTKTMAFNNVGKCYIAFQQIIYLE
jgi:hypothetical protein